MARTVVITRLPFWLVLLLGIGSKVANKGLVTPNRSPWRRSEVVNTSPCRSWRPPQGLAQVSLPQAQVSLPQAHGQAQVSLPQGMDRLKTLCPKRMGRLMTPCPKRRDRLKSLCPVAYARCNKRWPDFASLTPKRQDASVRQRLL